MKKSREITLTDLKPDVNNARLHTPRNIAMIVESLKEIGAARSIVIDESNVVLAGNGVLEAAGKTNLKEVEIIETSGNEIVAVRISNLDEQQKKRLALYDNRTAELAQWDTDILRKLENVDLTKFWTEGEIGAYLGIQSQPSTGSQSVEPPRAITGDPIVPSPAMDREWDRTASTQEPPQESDIKIETIEVLLASKEDKEVVQAWLQERRAQYAAGKLGTALYKFIANENN